VVWRARENGLLFVEDYLAREKTEGDEKE